LFPDPTNPSADHFQYHVQGRKKYWKWYTKDLGMRVHLYSTSIQSLTISISACVYLCPYLL